MTLSPEHLRAYVEYLRDLGVYDLYQRTDPQTGLPDGLRAAIASRAAAGPGAGAKAQATGARPIQAPQAAAPVRERVQSPFERAQARAGVPTPPATQAHPAVQAPLQPMMPRAMVEEAKPVAPAYDFEVPMPKPVSFNDLAPLPSTRVPASGRADALGAVRAEIGDCTRCPLAYAGRRNIVFADGDPQAQLMFVGEGPGADEDASGLPFVGKAGQLLNNMIAAMGLAREEVYIANIVKCRPPQNRVPEPVEANTCSPFLLQQIDIVQPKVIVALGSTAATYLLGVRQSLASLRGQWFDCRGSKVAVTYHPAFLLRDPRQKGEAWKDLQRVMAELGLKPKPKV